VLEIYYPTNEVDDEPAVAEPASGAAEEGLSVGGRQHGSVGGQAGKVAGVGQRIAQAEQARVAASAGRVRHGGVRAHHEEDKGEDNH